MRELAGGKSSIAFFYRIVGRRKDIKGHWRFARIDANLPLLTKPARAPCKSAATPAGLHEFTARLEKKVRERAPKAPRKRLRARTVRKGSRPDFVRLMQQPPASRASNRR